MGWEQSDWLAELSTGAKLGWVLLLGYVKSAGVRGEVKALSVRGAARRWGVGPSEIHELLDAATEGDDPALHVEDGVWTIPNWDDYQKPDPTAVERKRRERGHGMSQRDTVTDGVTCRVTETLTLTETETKPTAKRARALPDDWNPDDTHYAIARERGLTVGRELDGMRDWASSKGVRRLDWAATFRNWLRRATPDRQDQERRASLDFRARHQQPATTPDSEPTVPKEQVSAMLELVKDRMRISGPGRSA